MVYRFYFATLALALALPMAVSSFAPPPSNLHSSSQRTIHAGPVARARAPVAPTKVSIRQQQTRHYFFGNTNKARGAAKEEYVDYPEAKQATYDLRPGPFGFGPETIVYPLLKQTQLQDRKLKVIYNAKKDGWDTRSFHQKVDGKGASVVLAKVRGQWIGGYNPRGWASLGGARSSVAAFLFYQKNLLGGFQKLRASRTGSMACAKDEYGAGIYFGADSLIIPLDARRPRVVTSRLGYYFEEGPQKKSTLLPVKGADATVDELYVVAGVYADGEIIPNSGGVSELGFY